MSEPHHSPAEVFDRTCRLLEELTAISSPSGDREGLWSAARRLGSELERHHLAVQVRDEADGDGLLQPVLYARGPAAGERYLLLIGHLDTVLAAVAPERRDGRLYATGAIDMKGGLAAFVGALDLLATQNRRPAADFCLVVVPDEEVAGYLSKRAVETFGVGARGLWVLEPGDRRGEAETLVTGRRGMFHWQLDVRGRGAHAGNAYWQGRSALTAAADWCVGARQLALPGPGPTVNVARLVAGDEGFVDHLAASADLLGSSRQINVVPNRARAEGEVRFLATAEGERLRETLDALTLQIAERHDVAATFASSGWIPPLDPRGPGRRWSEVAVGLAAARGWQLEIEDNRGGISFPNFLPDPGVLGVLDGLGPVGGGMHTRDEFLDLASLDRRIVLLADLLAADAAGELASVR